MIHYQLRCRAEHSFDGWFRDSGTFDKQAAANLVSCPECGDTTVRRALMAPAVGQRRATIDQSGAPVSDATSPERQPAPAKAAAQLPDQMRALLQRLRVEIERTSDYVGQDFAEEARRIHRGETESRSIYGESSADEARALADEGIEVARIPWVPRADG